MAEMTEKATPKVEKVRKGECPWCNYQNADERVGPVHEAAESTLATTLQGNLQCNTCGKHWEKEALGKPWTIELERGPRWERENRARQIGGNLIG